VGQGKCITHWLPCTLPPCRWLRQPASHWLHRIPAGKQHSVLMRGLASAGIGSTPAFILLSTGSYEQVLTNSWWMTRSFLCSSSLPVAPLMETSIYIPKWCLVRATQGRTRLGRTALDQSSARVPITVAPATFIQLATPRLCSSFSICLEFLGGVRSGKCIECEIWGWNHLRAPPPSSRFRAISLIKAR
jgi:hypothetical protein